MKKKKILYIILAILIIPNLPVINKYVAHRLDEGHFSYSNADGSFTITQHFSFKSPGFSIFGFEQFVKQTSPESANSVLYRLYKINPLCFWRWSNYLRHAIHFEYRDWAKIEKQRKDEGGEIDSAWQQF